MTNRIYKQIDFGISAIEEIEANHSSQKFEGNKCVAGLSFTSSRFLQNLPAE